jgi:FkbM family methyltransferase
VIGAARSFLGDAGMRALARLQLRHRARRYRHRVDPSGIRWMLTWLAAGDVAVDVGAYKGGYTYWMRRAVGEPGAVLAFEPQAEAASLLRSYVAAFGWSNVEIVEAALSTEPGTRPLLRPGPAPSPAASLVGASLPPSPRRIDVSVDTLDRVLASRSDEAPVAFIKCDVEGHELDVLRGAEATLREHRPAILVECEARHLRGRSMTDVFQGLGALGYRGSFFWDGREEDVATFDVRVHQVEGRRPSANNFAFVWGRRA